MSSKQVGLYAVSNFSDQISLATYIIINLFICVWFHEAGSVLASYPGSL